MVLKELTAAALLAVLTSSCATGPATLPGREAAIPVFAADDARVQTAGFVGQTLRLKKDHEGTNYTLMAFAVGDTLTLGAMVKGPFTGDVRWQVGDRSLTFPFDAAKAALGATVTVDDDPAKTLRGHGAAFRGTAWINVDVPLAEWLQDGTSMQLTFHANDGALLALPDIGYYYVARLASRQTPPPR